ncbi:MAG: fumarylacetoacetate hydrolase family protein, partial [Pseudomonadota bacterium]
MKLLRVGEPGKERPAVLDQAGICRDLSEVVDDIAGPALSKESLAFLEGVDLKALPAIEGNPRIGPCVGSVGKFICIGLNYSDHAAESNLPVPDEPILFMKATSAISGPNDPVILPPGSTKSDWEVELGVVIGTHTRHVSQAEALDYVAGYCVVNDLSERAYQLEQGGQWVKGKSYDGFGPIGPWLVTADEVGDPQSLGLWLDLNDARTQTEKIILSVFPV